MDHMLRYCLLVLVTMVVLLGGCRPSMPVSSKNSEVRDSVSITVRDRIVPVKVPGAEFNTELNIFCDPVTNMPYIRPGHGNRESYSEKGTGEEFNALLEGNRLKISYLQDSISHLVRVRDSLVNRIRLERERESDVVYVHRPKWYDRVCYVVTVLTAVFVAFRAGKLYRNLKPF